MLKQYLFKGKKWQFDEKKAPEGAVPVVDVKVTPEVVEVKAVTPKNKAVTPANKAKKVSKK